MQRSKLEMEYLFKASPPILYQFLTTPSCLIRWFCDTADVSETHFVFSWEGFDERAEVLQQVENEMIRFKWEEDDNDTE